MIDQAVTDLRRLRQLGDRPVEDLHLLASLAAEIELRLPEVLYNAHEQHSWNQIHAVAAMTRDRAQRLASIFEKRLPAPPAQRAGE